MIHYFRGDGDRHTGCGQARGEGVNFVVTDRVTEVTCPDCRAWLDTVRALRLSPAHGGGVEDMGHSTLKNDPRFKHFKVGVTLDPEIPSAVTADEIVDAVAALRGVRAATCAETSNDILCGDDDTLSDAIARALADGSTMAMSETLRDALHQNIFAALRPLLGRRVH